MAPMSQQTSRLKVQLKLSISRLRMIQQKDTALAKQQRRAMAQLLESGKVESARIRVENIIRSDILTELHEILELYCELLLARIQLLDAASTPAPSKSAKSNNTASPTRGADPIIDPALDEAIRSLIHAAPRTDVKELHAARALLVEKAGKDASLAAMDGVGVAERVTSKLTLESPGAELVDAYLGEIARTYAVDWRLAGMESDDDDDDNPSGGIAESIEEPEREKEPALEAEPGAEDKADKAEALSKATPPRALGPQSPVRVTPPNPSVDNVSPKVKLPGPPDLKPGKKMEGKAKGNASGDKSLKSSAAKKPADDGPGGKIPDVDELAKRFAALKR